MLTTAMGGENANERTSDGVSRGRGLVIHGMTFSDGPMSSPRRALLPRKARRPAVSLLPAAAAFPFSDFGSIVVRTTDGTAYHCHPRPQALYGFLSVG